MQSFNLYYNFFAKNFLLSLSIFPLIFIFFLVFEVFFGNAHFIYAQISIIEIKPIEKKIVNVEQNLAKTENKNTSLVYEINPIVNDFSQRIISLDSQNNLLGTYEVNPISKNIQHIIYPDNSIPETYMQPFNQTGLNTNFILSYARGYVYSSFSIHELGEDVLSSEISNGKKQKQQQYTSYMIEPKVSLARPGINDFNISSTSNYTETIISSK